MSTAVGASSGQAVSITDFQYAGQFKMFLSYAGPLAPFRTLSAQGNLLPSAQAVVFTTNHDTERADAIYYADGKPYDLATVLLLAAPYGYGRSLMSSFAFDRDSDAGRALGPPSAAIGKTNSIYAVGSETPNCATDRATAAAGSWVCQHRAAFIAPMLGFRKATVGSDVTKV
jgi:alpha-amylase